MSDISLLGKIAGYTEILAKDPRSTVFVPLSEAYRQMGMLDDALQIARQGVTALPRYCPGHISLGRVLAQRGDLNRAIAAFEAALAIEHDNLTAIKGLAKVRILNRQPEEALQILLRGATINPGDEGVRKMLASLGPVHSRGAVVPEASLPDEPPMEKPVAGEPIATSTIAEIYVRQGLLKRAMKVYRDLLKIDPHNQEVRAKLIELKGRVEAQEAQGLPGGGDFPAAPAAQLSPAAEPSPAPETVFPKPTIAAVAAPVTVVAPQETRGEIHQRLLNRWLDAIARRREHV
jgi:tetratricopeptide (TPR) repeat protein